MTATDQTSTPRTPLNRERVLLAAVAYADEHGIASLSMRRLAKELGVEAMSLYNHVANKHEILSGIIELVTEEISLPDDEPDWKAAMRSSAISAKEAFLRHKWASGLMMSHEASGPATLRRAEWMLRTFREAGFSDDLTYHAYHVIGAYLLGVTNQHLAFPYRGEELADLAKPFIRELGDDYPYLLEHVQQHLEPAEGHTGGFELGLDLLLDGFERLRDAEAAA